MAVELETTIQRFICLSTDTKPTTAGNDNIPNGSLLFERDTKLVYKYSKDADAWTILSLPFGLIYAGTCDSGMTGSTTDLYCADLAGYGNDYFNEKFYVQIIKNADSVGNAPDNEIRKVTDYVSATGKIVCDAFSANVEESDEIWIIHKSIMMMLLSLPEVDAWALSDKDDFDVADADADNERWDVGYISGAAGGSADINTTTAGKLMVKAVYNIAGAERYAVNHNLPLYGDYFKIEEDVNCTWGSTNSATAKAVGIGVSKGTTYDSNNYLFVERQKGTGVNRIQVRYNLNNAGEQTVNVAITDDALAFKIERWDETWRIYYSTAQYPAYDWILITQIEDPSNFLTNQVTFYQEAFNGAAGDANETAQGDFDNWRYWLGTGGGSQYIAGDYDSSWVSRDKDGNVFERVEDIEQELSGTAGIATFPGASNIGDGVSLAEAIRAILTSLVGGDDYDNYTTINNTANASINAAFQNIAAVLGADGANVFNPTIQGSARTNLELALAALATYISASGAALSIQVNNNAARDNLEQVWEDFLAVVGCDNANIFNPTIQGSARTDLDAALAALATYVSPTGAAMSLQVNNQVARTNLEQALEDFFAVVGCDGVNAFSSTIQGVARTTIEAAFDGLAAYISPAGAAYSSTVDPGGAARTDIETTLEDLGKMLAGAGGITTYPAVGNITDGTSLAVAIRAILNSLVGDDYDNYTNISNSANATVNAIFQKFAVLFAADGANVFNPTIQGVARTDLELALAALATYITAAGAALSVQVNGGAARDNLEQIWEDYLAVIGCDGANVFNPSIGGSARTDLDAALAALGTIIGNPTADTLTSITAKLGNLARSLATILGTRWDAAGDLGTDIAAILTALGSEFDGSPDVYDVLVTGHDSSAIAANEDGSIEERLEALKSAVLNQEFFLALEDDFDVADADANNERWDVGYINGTEGGSADINTTTAGMMRVAVDPDGTPTAAGYAAHLAQALTSRYFRTVVDLDVSSFGTPAASWATLGMRISPTTYDSNNVVYIQRQSSSDGVGNRLCVGAIFASVNQGEVYFTTADNAFSFMVERLDNVWRLYYSLTQYPDYVWVLLTQYEDSAEGMNSQQSIYLDAYSPGNADTQTAVGDFDNFKIYYGVSGLTQQIAGDYVSSQVANDFDGSLMEVVKAGLEQTTGGAYDPDTDSNEAISEELAKVPKSDSNVSWNATALGDINAQVDTALNTQVPASPTVGSLNDILSKAAPGNTFDKSTDSLEALADNLATVDGIVDNVTSDTQIRRISAGSKAIASGATKWLNIDSGTNGAEIIGILIKGLIGYDWTLDKYIPTDDAVADTAAGDKRGTESYFAAQTEGGELESQALPYNMFLDFTNNGSGSQTINDVVIIYRSRAVLTLTWET